METMSPVKPVNFDGVLTVGAMAGLLRTSDDTIRRRVRAGKFPIPPLEGIDTRLRWWGPAVKAWLDAHRPPPPGRRRRRPRKEE